MLQLEADYKSFIGLLDLELGMKKRFDGLLFE